MYFRRETAIIFDRISAPYELAYYALVTCAAIQANLNILAEMVRNSP